ncbi:tetratricopeptide repeat protein [uncultured Roseovarius sp.]|uniref:tetratricopeptide repeat protein n=1 Tax=uncultured Roseovarius sp. TaxID=293344 RepID=UPI00261CD42C|nr:tetratricopeptide repeat protein [uncultured Roseovarius sp.]
MSDTDSFIDEVTEEVRRDRLFALMRRYGWIAVLVILLLVGGAAWNEWRKAQERDAAEALGDKILAALARDDRAARAAALGDIDAPSPQVDAVVTLLAAAEGASENPADAAERLLALADRDGVDQVYRQIATLKAVMLPDTGLDAETRRTRLNGLALTGGVLRLLAEEQLALIDLETGNRAEAVDRLSRIATDAEATAGLRRRVTQVMVALGEELPDLPAPVQGGVAVSE